MAISSSLLAMKVCEFLLQKEGDRVWLPLEPPTVEILEGRYRIVARTQQPQTEVFVEVSYWSPEDMPPKRRTRHWNRHTNAKGIMPVLPFTTLRSGNWRVQCSSDLLEDMEDGGWQHRVELRVLAQEDDREDWQRNPLTSPGTLSTRPRDRQPEPSSTSSPSPTLFVPETVSVQPGESIVEAVQPRVEATEEARRAKVEDLRSLAEQMAYLVMDTVLEAGASDPIPPPEDDETREFFTVDRESDSSPTADPPLSIADLTPEPSLESRLDSESDSRSQSRSQSQLQTTLNPLNPPPVTNITPSETEVTSTPPIVPAPIAAGFGPVPTLPEGIQLQLQTNTIVPSPYSLFELHGYIVTANGAPLLESPLPLQARVMLKNPSNMEVRLAMTHLLATKPIDQPFYLSGHIALDWRNQLLLGEVQLQSLNLSVEDLTEDVVTIASAPFTLMPSVDALLTQVSPPEEPGVPAEEAPLPEVAPPRKPIRADFLEVTRRSQPRSVPNALGNNTLGNHALPDNPNNTVAVDPPASDRATNVAHPPAVIMPPSLKAVSPDREGTRPEPNLPTFIHPRTELGAVVTDAAPEMATDETGGTDGTGGMAESFPKTFTDHSADSLAPESQDFEPQDLEPQDLEPQDLELPSSESPDLELFDASNPELAGAQLTLLNLADWTDPAIAIEPSPEQDQEQRREESVSPRRSIELPPVPSRSLQAVEEASFLAPDPLDPKLSAAELNAFAAEVPLSAVAHTNLTDLTDLTDLEETSAEAIVAFETDPNTPDPNLPEPEDAALRDFDAENEILLSLDPEGDSNWSPSVLTTVLDSDRALQLSTPDYSSEAVALENTDSSLPPDSQREEDFFLDPSPSESSPSEPHQLSDIATAEASLATDNEPFVRWEEEPTAKPEALPDFGVGEFFSHEALPATPVSHPNPILDSFFTETVSEKASQKVSGTASEASSDPADMTMPVSLSFTTESDGEFLEQVKVPPHLELSELDLSDSELWDLESGLSSGLSSGLFSPPQRQSEPFIPEHLRQEIVVEDEWLEPDTRHWMSSAPPEVGVVWPEAEPLPLPSLELPSEDLVGGETIRVTVRLPNTQSRLFVKLWLLDCQTRSLAAGPFWVYQFLPTLPQFQEAILEILVPLGCLEIQFEALTIEAETQRESHKFTMVRPIVPSAFQEPEENLLPPDDFLDYLPSALDSALDSTENDRLP